MNENINQTPNGRPAPDWRLFGRIGGLKRAATSDMNAVAAHARAAKARKWREGHGCRICGPYIAIPCELSETERARRGEALRKRHYVLLGSRSKKR